MTNKERHEFKEKVLELRMQYYSTEKIAELLHSNSDTVMLYIKILISEGKLDESYMNLKKNLKILKVTQHRWECIYLTGKL